MIEMMNRLFHSASAAPRRALRPAIREPIKINFSKLILLMKSIKLTLATLALAALPFAAFAAGDACKKCCSDKGKTCAECCIDTGKTCGKDCCKE
jgi:hypothetical protein